MLNISPKVQRPALIVAVFALLIWQPSLPLSLLLGLVFALVIGNRDASKTQALTALLLKTSIVLLGLNLSVQALVKTSQEGLLLVLLSVLFTLVAGSLLAKLFRIDTSLGWLISSGTAICGASAVAATAPVIKAQPAQVTVAISVLFVFNALALWLFPYFGYYLALSPDQFGLWSALAIHDTASVVATAAEFSADSVVIATTVKLARVLCLVPLLYWLSYRHKQRQTRILPPLFIGLFVLAVLVGDNLPFSQNMRESIALWVSSGFLVAIFLLGSCLNLSAIKQIPASTLWFASLLWILVTTFSLLLIVFVL